MTYLAPRSGRALVALLSALILVGCSPQQPPSPTSSSSSAALAPPAGVGASARWTTAVVSWQPSDGLSYRVEVAPRPDFSDPQTATVTGSAASFSQLTPGSYFVRVIAVAPDGRTSDPSPTVAFTATYPAAPPVLKLESTTSSSISATWSATGAGLAYETQLANDDKFTDPKSQTGRKSEATFAELKPKHRYFLRVRVVDETDAPLSDWSPVAAGEVAEFLPLVVGSYNVLKPGGKPSWEARRAAVARTILGSGVDVVGLQEATPIRVKGGRRQYSDVIAALGGGWALTETARFAGGEARTAYNSATLTLISHGHETLKGSDNYGTLRYGTWAVFEQKSTQKRFLFVNTHLSPPKTAAATKARDAQTRQLVAMARRANRDDLPVIVVGDFNSHKLAGPGNGVWRTLTSAGYLDPLKTADKLVSADVRIRTGLKTFNGQQRHAPIDTTQPMIDHIFVTKMKVAEWETVAKLDRAGRFVGTIPSDHNLIRATVFLP